MGRKAEMVRGEICSFRFHEVDRERLKDIRRARGEWSSSEVVRQLIAEEHDRLKSEAGGSAASAEGS